MMVGGILMSLFIKSFLNWLVTYSDPVLRASIRVKINRERGGTSSSEQTDFILEKLLEAENQIYSTCDYFSSLFSKLECNTKDLFDAIDKKKLGRIEFVE